MAIRVYGEELGDCLRARAPEHCLDLVTGRVKPKADCPPEETGFGRPGVQAGKRYIELPSLDELHAEFYERRRQEDEELLGDPDEHDPAFLEAQEFDRRDFAAHESAMRWLGTLGITEEIHWVDEALLASGINAGVSMVLDPHTQEWRDLG